MQQLGESVGGEKPSSHEGGTGNHLQPRSYPQIKGFYHRGRGRNSCPKSFRDDTKPTSLLGKKGIRTLSRPHPRSPHRQSLSKMEDGKYGTEHPNPITSQVSRNKHQYSAAGEWPRTRREALSLCDVSG